MNNLNIDNLEIKNELNNFLIPIRRYIHQNPELGFNTYETAKYIKKVLDNLGYQTTLIINNAGVIGKLDLNKKNTIAFRSETDALPIKELTNLEFKSNNDNMHACGHDAHMAILLASAYLFKKYEKELNVNITLIFQPAEEGPLPGGALSVIDTKLIDNVKDFYAYHVTNSIPSFNIGIKQDEVCAAPDLWELNIKGKGCHAASPQMGINPIMIASEISLEFNKFYLNEKVKNENIVITTTYLHSGVSMNIVPECAIMKGTARSMNNSTRDYFKASLTDIANRIANKYNASCEFIFHYAYDPVYNDNDVIERLLIAANNVKNDSIKFISKPQLIGDDFSYYRKIGHTCYSFIGVRGKNQECFDLHSPYFILDEDSLYYGALVNINVALNY